MTINKSVSINATSTATDGTAIAYFNANVSESGTTSNMSIQNQELYEANKQQVRADKADFDNAVYGVEDEQSSKTVNTTTTTD